MEKPLSLRKNFSWTFAGSIIALGCQWLMLAVMAKMLPKEEVGYYALALAITAPVVLFSMIQLRAVQVTDVQNRYQFGDYLGIRLLTNFVAVLIVVCIFFGLSGRYSLSVYGVIFIVALNKIIESTSDISYGLMQKHERLDKVALSLIYRNLGGVILLSLVLYLTGNLIYGVSAIGLWWLLVLLFFDKNNVEKFTCFTPRFHIKSVFSILWFGLPLGFAKGLMTLTANTPRYFVEAHLGTVNLAIFAAMAYAVIGANRCVQSLGYSAFARLTKYFVDNRKAYIILLSKMIVVAIGMALAVVLFGVFFGKQFLTIVYKQDYAQQPNVFVWLMVVAGSDMISSMLQHGVIAARRFKSQVPLYASSLSVCFIACWFLVPKYGMKGTAWAMLLSVISKIVGSLFIIIWALRVPPKAGTQTIGDLSNLAEKD